MTDELANYIRRFRAALSDLPADEVADIVRELECHVADKLAAGHNSDQIRRALGDPKEYAQQFLAEADGAGSDGEPPRVALTRIAAACLPAALAVFATILFALKLFNWPGTGLFVAPDDWAIGAFPGPPPGSREVLGGWWLVLWSATAVGCGWLVRRLVAPRRG